MQLNVISYEGKSINTLTVSDDCFNHQFNEPLVHQIVVAYLAKARAGTQAQKTRSEVRGGGKKPWRQKGTGRARAGSIRSPLWRKGGVIFAAKPRDYEQKINRKMYRSAMRAILSELIRQDRLKIINDFSLEEAKTKQLFGKLQSLNVNDVLIVIDAEDSKLTLAARNIPNVDVCLVNLINPINLINHENVMITLSAFKKIEELLA